MKELDLEYWDNKDGSVGAFIHNIPGAIWAKDVKTYITGITHIVKIFEEDFRQRENSSATSGIIDLKAEMQWIDGRLCVRWMAIPGFGMDFTDEEEVKTFIASMMILPTEQQRKAKLN